MKDVITSITVAFSKILSWHTIRLALLSGIIATLIWIGFGYLLWDYILALSSKTLEYVPFSLIKSNGAWMLSLMLWFQLTLITFALIYAFFGNFILDSTTKDKYTSFSLITVFLSALFWGIIWFFVGDNIYQQFLQLFNWLPFETVEKGLAFIIGLYIIYNAIVVTLLFIASIFSQPLIELEFEDENIVEKNTFVSVKYTIKDTLIFIALSIVAFPLLFVPILNFFVQLILWIWLYKDTLSFDALALNYENPNKSLLKEHKVAIYFITLVAVLFNFLPIFNIIGPFFGEIAMFHYINSMKKSK
jgi:hypothetical protein